jgi:hypothetical protein
MQAVVNLLSLSYLKSLNKAEAERLLHASSINLACAASPSAAGAALKQGTAELVV